MAGYIISDSIESHCAYYVTIIVCVVFGIDVLAHCNTVLK